MKFKNRWLWLGSLALAAIVLLTLLAAPQSGPQSSQLSGSSYSRTPDGYSAWYAYMQAQKQPIQRWQRPASELWPEQEQSPDLPPVQQIAVSSQLPITPITLMRVDPTGKVGDMSRTWIERGNRLVLLGARPAVTNAPFESAIPSPVGAVKIATSRRHPGSASAQLADRFGAIVWQQQLGLGQVIYVATPHLGANAYQDEPGNFKFLAQLVAQPGQAIYIDEFLHGYHDRAAAEKAPQSLPQYLAQTPLLLLAVQAVILLLCLIWGQRRLGRPQPLLEPAPNNSQAYITAMAAVLQKANCGDFVVQTVGRAEQITLQQALGLGSIPLLPQAVVDAWVQQTGRSAHELDWLNLLQSTGLAGTTQKRWRDQDLRQWLAQIQTTRYNDSVSSKVEQLK